MSIAVAPESIERAGRRRRPPPARIPFRVFLGYADLPAARRAAATITDAVRNGPRRFEIQPKLWRFDQLASPKWRPFAISAALDSDAIVLASSTGTQPLQSLEEWVAAFLQANRGRPTTIVALSGSSDAWTITIQEPRGEPPTSEIPGQATTAPRRSAPAVA